MLHWSGDSCQAWQYKRREDGHYVVVGKCRIGLYLLPLGSKFNIQVWSRDIYHTFTVGQRAYQDFPLPYYIDPLHEKSLDGLPGPANR